MTTKAASGMAIYERSRKIASELCEEDPSEAYATAIGIMGEVLLCVQPFSNDTDGARRLLADLIGYMKAAVDRQP